MSCVIKMLYPSKMLMCYNNSFYFFCLLSVLAAFQLNATIIIFCNNNTNNNNNNNNNDITIITVPKTLLLGTNLTQSKSRKMDQLSHYVLRLPTQCRMAKLS